MSPTQRTGIELYRDLFRLVNHIAPGSSPKSIMLRAMIRTEFDKSRSLSPDNAEDAPKIESMKSNAVRALSNYMLYEGGIHDRKSGGKLGVAMDRYHEKNVQGMQQQQNNKDGSSGGGGSDATKSS